MGRVRTMAEGSNWFDFQVLHPYFGYTLDPSRTPWPADEFGFLNGVSPLSVPTPDILRVGIIGGSVAMFLTMNHRDTLRDDLASRLGRAPETVEILSFAHGGHKQPQQLMVLNILLVLGMKLDVLINLDGFNEIALHPAENGTKEVDVIYPRAWYFTIDPFKSSKERLLAARMQIQRERMTALAQRRTRSFPPLTSFIRILESLGARESRRLEEQFRNAAFPDLSYQTKGRGKTYTTDHEMFTQLADLWKKSSAQLAAICGANGIAYYHFLQPNQYFPDTKPLTLEERTLFYQPDHPYRFGAMNGYPYLLRGCEELRAAGVTATDLTKLFRDTRETTYMDTCCHLNELGNRMLSKQIAATLTESQKSG
jgi:hypothetical protein